MKGVIGAIACDYKECPHAFINNKIDTKPFSSREAADLAEKLALEAGWSTENRGKLKHYCPGHTKVRAQEIQDRARAAQLFGRDFKYTEAPKLPAAAPVTVVGTPDPEVKIVFPVRDEEADRVERETRQHHEEMMRSIEEEM